MTSAVTIALVATTIVVVVPVLLMVLLGRRKKRLAGAALARGEDVLARWRVDADLWRDWRAFEPQLQADDNGRRNELHNQALPDDGFDVVAGRSAIDIGGHVFLLPQRGTPEIQQATVNDARARPSFLDVGLKYPGGGSGASGAVRAPTYTVLRIPVPVAALEGARRAAAHYNGDVPGTPDFFHGRGDGTDPEDLTVCWSCGYRTYKLRSECPQCGSSLQSRRWSRRFGAVMALLGLVLVVGMLVLLYFMGPSLLHPGETARGITFSGSPAKAMVVLLLLCAVLAFGAGALGYGAWQVATGKRDRRVVFGMIGLVGVAAAVGLVMAFAAGK